MRIGKDAMSHFQPKPQWLKAKANAGKENQAVMELLRGLRLHTVCEEADCPNCGECFGRRTATFMILGRQCTRNCRFCSVTKGTPSPVDDREPENIAEAVQKLNLRHVVITSVTRDDLPDGGAGHFAAVIKAIRHTIKENTPVIEVLTPDFQGNIDALQTVVNAQPDILNHNIETVPRLYPAVRPMAQYERSLKFLQNVKRLNEKMITKSGIMVGLGETQDEVGQVLSDLRKNECDLLTIGQYLAPTKEHYPVYEYITPELFLQYEKTGRELGFAHVASGPLVRSSYLADQAFLKIKENISQI